MRNVCKIAAVMAIAMSTPAAAQIATVAKFFPNCAPLPDAAGHTLTVGPAGNADAFAAAVRGAQPGDTIALKSGDYGVLDLRGAKKSGFVTITAAPGQTPHFTKINIGEASHLRLTGLSIYGPAGTNQGTMVLILNSDNIVFDHNIVQSHDGNFAWAPMKLGEADSPSNGLNAQQSSCVSITDNTIRNIVTAIAVGGDQKDNRGQYYLVGNNVIDNYAGDGIDHYGSHVRIENNRIVDGHDMCNNCVHQDGIQGWNYNLLPVHNSDVVIDGNTIISQVTPNLAMPSDALQGITIFNGDWDDVHVFNNVVLVNAYHGITLNWVRSGSIINNTLGSTNPAHGIWIMATRTKDIPNDAPYNMIVRNNAVPGPMNKNSPALVAYWAAGNYGLKNDGEYANAFVKFDRAHSDYDLHLAKGSPLIGAGLADGAPPTDIEGHPRKAPIDIGAYAYQH